MTFLSSSKLSKAIRNLPRYNDVKPWPLVFDLRRIIFVSVWTRFFFKENQNSLSLSRVCINAEILAECRRYFMAVCYFETPWSGVHFGSLHFIITEMMRWRLHTKPAALVNVQLTIYLGYGPSSSSQRLSRCRETLMWICWEFSHRNTHYCTLAMRIEWDSSGTISNEDSSIVVIVMFTQVRLKLVNLPIEVVVYRLSLGYDIQSY